MTKYFAASHVLIWRGDTFLVTKRAAGQRYMPNKWDLPGGTIEAGEDPVTALKREIMEEISIDVEIGPCLYVYNNMVQFPERQTFQIIFLGRFLHGEVQLNAREHSEYRWVNKGGVENLDKINFLESLVAELKNREFSDARYLPDFSAGW